MVSCRAIFGPVWGLRRPLFIIVVILAALPIVFLIDEDTMPETAVRCLYILVVMATLWVTETVSVSATALLPSILFPLAGVMPAKQISGFYINDTSMLFLGGLVVAVAVEEVNLHKRIAVLILKGAGSNPKWLMAGIMLPSWFLSMWISNTAAASMMVPIINAIIQQTRDATNRSSEDGVAMAPVSATPADHRDDDGGNGHPNKLDNPDVEKNQKEVLGVVPTNSESDDNRSALHASVRVKTGVEKKVKGATDRLDSVSKALTLAVAYACNVGGMATLTGTPPNLVMRGVADDFYRSYQIAAKSNDTSGSGITFSSWMAMALPLSFLVLVMAWVILVLTFLTGRGCCTKNVVQASAVKKIIDKEWKSLGRMTLAEIQTLIVFILLTILWISRDPKESPGWGTLFKSGYVTDSVSAMLCAWVLFVLPAQVPNAWCCRKKGSRANNTYLPILTWKKVEARVPWGVLLLLGGGFALANGCKESGLSRWLGDQLSALDYLDSWVFNLVICLIVAAFTEVTSNTATATLLMPILADMAVSLKINPLYLMMSAVLATSFAFMLPVATPPNAIVFSYGQIKIVDMACVGVLMNIMAVALMTLCVNTWGKLIFDFDNFDPIFNATLPVTSS